MGEVTTTGTRVLEKLTKLDRQTLIALCEGRTNAEMAERFGTSQQIVKNRIRNVLRRTGCKRRLDLAIFAFYHGIVACPCGRAER